MRRIVKLICVFLSLFITESSVFLYRRIKNYIGGQIICNWFRECGSNVSISLPCVIRGAKYIKVGDFFTVRGGLRLEAIDRYLDKTYQPSIVFGKNVSINDNCHIGAISEMIIGDDVVIASRVFITDHFHGDSSNECLSIPVIKRDLYRKGNVIIGNNVWIGEGVVIMPGVVLGDNCIVGANSVVTKSFSCNSVIAGVPAKKIN